jgi:small-conductance mechanosensitive channel
VKEVWIYTGMRIGLFLASLLLVTGVWLALSEDVDASSALWIVVISFLLSGVGSYFLLNRQREAFARRVEERAQRMTARFDEIKSREDAD